MSIITRTTIFQIRRQCVLFVLNAFRDKHFPLPPPFLATPYMIQSAYNIRTREGGVTFMSIIRSRASRQSDIAGFLYLTLFRSDFASFVREISSYIRFNLEQFLFRVG